MISKRRLSRRQRILLRTIDMSESLATQVPWILFLGASIVCAVGIHKMVNHHIRSKCDLVLYQLVETPTAFGPAYTCVSRPQYQGPPAPLKD